MSISKLRSNPQCRGTIYFSNTTILLTVDTSSGLQFPIAQDQNDSRSASIKSADGDWPAPANLSAVFDHFVADTSLHGDSLMMEVAGAQCLLMAGFFEDQMRRRHNIRWYAELGSGFFSQAAVHERSSRKARILDSIARRFEPWRQRHARLSRTLRDQPYLLTPS